MTKLTGTLRVIATLTGVLPLLSCTQGGEWSPAEAQAVETALADFRRAWLDNDKARVMEMVADDVVLFVPGTAATSVIGKARLESFWFPASDTVFLIRKYEITDQEIHGGGVYAIAQGKSLLSWDTVSKDSVLSVSTSSSEYLSVLKKENGKWRIFRQMFVLRT